MSTTLTTRISDDLASEIERISKEVHLDKSAVTRRLLERAVTDHRRDRAFARYERGEVSLRALAREANMSVRELLPELRRRGVHFEYSEASLREDFPDE